MELALAQEQLAKVELIFRLLLELGSILDKLF